MRRLILLVTALPLLCLSGCGLLSDIGRGARDGFAEALPGAVANVVADRLEKRDAGLSEAIRNLPGQMPKAPEQKDNTLAYGLAFLIAKLAGDGVGGLARRALKKGEA